MSFKSASTAGSARNWLNHLLKNPLVWSRKLRITCFAWVLYWVFFVFERQAYNAFATAIFLKLIRSKSGISRFVLVLMRRMVTASRPYAVLLYLVLASSRFFLSVLTTLVLTSSGLENFMLLWFWLRGDVSGVCEPGKQRRMLRDDILKGLMSVSSEHETKEKREERRSSW